MTTPLPEPMMPSIADAGRSILVEASIVHAKSVELKLCLDQAVNDFIDGEGPLTEDEAAAGAAIAHLRELVAELGELSDWLIDDHDFYDGLLAIKRSIAHLEETAAGGRVQSAGDHARDHAEHDIAERERELEGGEGG